MSRPKPPPAGVSGLTEMGGRKPVASGKPPKRQKSGDLKPGVGQQVNPNRATPGVGTVRRSVVTVPIAGGRRPKIATFTSVDGTTYSYYRENPHNGAKIEGLEVFAAFLALREIALGGSPLNVMLAFGTKLVKDMHGNTPIMPSMDEAQRVVSNFQEPMHGLIGGADVDEDEAEAQGDFALAESV